MNYHKQKQDLLAQMELLEYNISESEYSLKVIQNSHTIPVHRDRLEKYKKEHQVLADRLDVVNRILNT